MNKAVSLALLAGGILLIIFGVSAAGSFSSDISRFFAGSPTDKAIWMLIGGVVLSIIGRETRSPSEPRWQAGRG